MVYRQVVPDFCCCFCCPLGLGPSVNMATDYSPIIAIVSIDLAYSYV